MTNLVLKVGNCQACHICFLQGLSKKINIINLTTYSEQKRECSLFIHVLIVLHWQPTTRHLKSKRVQASRRPKDMRLKFINLLNWQL